MPEDKPNKNNTKQPDAPSAAEIAASKEKASPTGKKPRFSLIKYIKNSYAELLKVTWPTRDEALRSTGIVILFSVAVAMFLGGLDYIYNQGLDYLIALN